MCACVHVWSRIWKQHQKEEWNMCNRNHMNIHCSLSDVFIQCNYLCAGQTFRINQPTNPILAPSPFNNILAAYYALRLKHLCSTLFAIRFTEILCSNFRAERQPHHQQQEQQRRRRQQQQQQHSNAFGARVSSVNCSTQNDWTKPGPLYCVNSLNASSFWTMREFTCGCRMSHGVFAIHNI